MKLSIRIILSILIFVSSVYLSFIYESEYRKIVRWLYEFLTNNKISFNHPAKYLHFASGAFVSSISIYLVVILNLIFKHERRTLLINTCLSLTLFPISLVLYSIVDSNLKIIECTMCDDGLRTLDYNDILYDRIMILSLIISLIPWIISEYKNMRKKAKVYNTH